MTPLHEARERGAALAAFTVYNLEQAQGVIAAAEAERAPILLMAGSSAFRYAGREPLAALALAAAAASAAPVGVHLDHCTDLDELEFCVDAGYGSVMYDGSALPYERNVEATRAAAEIAHAGGAWIEGELTGVAGAEDASEAVAMGERTDPAAAADFVARTGVDALAVSVGNVHGMAADARLDLDLLARIAAAVDVPLVLHGASGLPAADVRRAIALGVCKLNVNTELRRAFRAALAAAPPGDDLASLMRPAVDAVRDAARRKIAEFQLKS